MNETINIPISKDEVPLSKYYITAKSGFIKPFWMVKERRRFWFDRTVAKFEYERYDAGKALAIDMATTLEKGISC